MKRGCFIGILLIAIIRIASAQCDGRYLDAVPDSFTMVADQVFGGNYTSDGVFKELTLDLYLPAQASGELRPLVVFLHGGSFIGGGKGDGEVVWFCRDLAKRGIAAASINYRTESDPLALLSEETMVKAVMRAVEDNKAAMRYFYKLIEEGNPYQLDPDAIFLGGSSAGSITALHTVFMDDFEELKPRYQEWLTDLGIDVETLEGNSGNPGYTGNIAGLINISGAIVRLEFMDGQEEIPMLSMHNEIDLAVPYQFGLPYFIPTLPIVAGSRPIHHYRLAQGASSRLITLQGINHVPHTAYDGSQFQPVYDWLLEELLLFVEQNSPCNITVTAAEETLLSDLRVFPNPVSGILTFEWTMDPEPMELRLLGTNGQILTDHLQAGADRWILPEHVKSGWHHLLIRGEQSGSVAATPLVIVR